MTNEERAIEIWGDREWPWTGPCGCVGPRDGNPLCPCGMMFVVQVDGEFYKIGQERSVGWTRITATKIEPKEI